MSNATQSTGHDPVNNATSKTSFGVSQESHAQIEDAQVLASQTAPGERLNLYRLVPTAPAEDPRWQGAPPPGEVVVAARSAGDARIVAAGAEVDFTELNAVPAEDVTTRNASVFRDEKIYTVIEVEHDCEGLTRGLFEGDVSMDTICPLQAETPVASGHTAGVPAYGSTK